MDPAGVVQGVPERRLDVTDGKTRKEIMRCLKRYVARQVHRAIASDLCLHQPRSAPVELTA